MGLEETSTGWQATGAGTSSGVTVTKAASSDATQKHMIAGIDVSGDAGALVTIESPVSTVLWRLRFAGAFNYSREFAPNTYKGADGAAVLVKISASTSNCEANIHGYTID